MKLGALSLLSAQESPKNQAWRALRNILIIKSDAIYRRQIVPSRGATKLAPFLIYSSYAPVVILPQKGRWSCAADCRCKVSDLVASNAASLLIDNLNLIEIILSCHNLSMNAQNTAYDPLSNVTQIV